MQKTCEMNGNKCVITSLVFTEAASGLGQMYNDSVNSHTELTQAQCLRTEDECCHVQISTSRSVCLHTTCFTASCQ